MSNDKLNGIKRAIQEAPLLSPNASQLLQITVDPEHSLVDVVKIVKFDSVLTARLLRVVNSAAFKTLYPITSIERAVAYLGERMVVGVAIADNAAKLFAKPLTGYEGEKGDLWRHDLFAAFAAREVARFAKSDLGVDLAFTGGLLHDIGKAIISDYLKGTSQEAVAGIEKGEVNDYLAAEQNELGLDHTVVGYELAQVWQLPTPLQQAILHHHDPDAADEELRPFVYAVHLGDVIAMMGGYGTGSDSMQYQLKSNYTEYFDLSADNLASIMLIAQEEFNRAEESLTI